MALSALYEKYAELVIRQGVNLKKGQPLKINASVRDYEFVRLCVRNAYERGASKVTVEWNDTEVNRLAYAWQDMETLCDIPDWERDKEALSQKKGTAMLRIASDAPGGMKDIDPKKMTAVQKAAWGKMGDLMTFYTNNHSQWCIVALPGAEWAQKVFPEDDAQTAFKKLEDAIFTCVRVAADNDPVAVWEEHNVFLETKAKKMTEYAFDRLHFTSASTGTDLTVGLVKDHLWVAGGSRTDEGLFFVPNMPTEECFCMPHKLRTNGTVYASKPLNWRGNMIRDFWFTFTDGAVTDFGAGEGRDILETMLNGDEGAKYLGEVALVPYDSPVNETGILFLNTLFDENAACHLALGRPYPENIAGGCEMTREELAERGANASSQHVDFMFGTQDMCVDGITESGETVPVFRNGKYVI